MNLTNIAQHFSDAGAAREFMESLLWPDGAVCPHCGVIGESYKLKAKPDSKSPVRPGVWKCGGCRKQFTVTKGTIFEDSHIPLNIWLMAIHLVCSSKKGISAHQLHRMLGVTYQSAWFMAHRIRYAVASEPMSFLMTGIVAIDETYIGGKMRTGPQSVKPGQRPRDKRKGTDNKKPVVALVQRDGSVRSHHVRRITAANLKPIIEANIAPNAQIMTDSSTVLQGALMGRNHYQVNHRDEEYVRHEKGLKITTNTVEGFGVPGKFCTSVNKTNWCGRSPKWH
jgi:transposase-like protein